MRSQARMVVGMLFCEVCEGLKKFRKKKPKKFRKKRERGGDAGCAAGESI